MTETLSTIIKFAVNEMDIHTIIAHIAAQNIRIMYTDMIRRITEADIPACANVIKRSFSTVAEELGITESSAPRYVAFLTTAEKLMSQLADKNRHMYGYFDGENIIGLYALQIMDNDECELCNLCVLPEYRNRNIGENLMKNACDNAKSMNIRVIKLGLVYENTRLIKWYEKFGFVHTGTQRLDFFPFTCGYMQKEL